jgi:integrase
MKGNLTRRGERSWRLKYDVAPVNGQRQIRYKTLKGTKAQAEAEAAKIIATVASGTHVDPSRETVSQFIERWLSDWADNNVSNKTWTRYAGLLRKHIASRVGAVPLQKLQATHLQTIYAAMAKKGLADRTRLHTHRVVSTMLRHAAQWGVVSRNVASLANAPRVQAKEIEILAPMQIAAILEMLRGHPIHPIVALAFGTGLRRGELLALRWQDIHLDAGYLRVEQALEETTRGGLQFRPPKSKYGRRRVSLAPSTIAVLREHWKAQQEQRLRFGLGRAEPSALVFPNAMHDGPRSPNALSKEWRSAMREAGLDASFHSLRHAHVSTLIASGLNVLAISRRVGHYSPSLTLSVYGHLFPSDDRAASAIEAALTGQ